MDSVIKYLQIKMEYLIEDFFVFNLTSLHTASIQFIHVHCIMT